MYQMLSRILFENGVEGWDPETIIKWGNAAGAIVAGRLMCADDMPTIADIEALLAERDGDN